MTALLTPTQYSASSTGERQRSHCANALQPARVEFEVAVIRPTATRAIRIDGAQVHFTGFLLREYVARAYQVRVSQVIGPDWLSSSPFDIDAKFPEGSTPAQVTDMLQALLADRFSLEQHREQTEMPVYAIVVGKPPLRLKDSVGDPNANSRIEALVNITGYERREDGGRSRPRVVVHRQGRQVRG